MERKGILFILLMGILALGAYATNYAIVVGIDDYRYLAPLTYAEKDARDMETVLKGFGYEVTLLTGRTATKEVIRSEIAYLSEEAERKSGEGKLLFFYFSGHGIGGEETGLFTTYMKPGDKPYTQKELIEDLEQFPGERVLFLDACYQGQGRSELVRKPKIDIDTAIQEKRLDLFIAASASNELTADGFVFEGEKVRNGVATYLFLRGIETKEADINYDGSFTVGEIGEYYERMKGVIQGEISQRPEARYAPEYYRSLLLSGARQGTQPAIAQPTPVKGTCLLKIKAGNELAKTGTVRVDGKDAGEWEAGWIFVEDIPKGAYTIELDGDQIEKGEWEITFTKEYEVKEITVEGKKANRAVKIAIEPRSGSIWIEGIEKGTGIVQEMLEVGGIYQIEGKLPGYETKEETLRVPTKGERIDWTLTLEKIYAQTYEIASEPSGAEVEIDGEKKGKTPLTVELEQGEHRIRAKKEGYEDGEQAVSVEGILQKDLARTQKNAIRMVLTAKTYTIEAKSQPSSGGTVKIDNGSWGTNRSDQRGYGSTVTVEAAENSGYRFNGWYEGNNRISGSTRYSWTVTGNKTLEARYTALTGTVRIESDPSGAEVYIGGSYKDLSRSDKKTPYELTGNAGSYEVEVKKSGYVTQTGTIEIRAGQTTVKRFTLTAEQTPAAEGMVLVKRGSFQMGNVNNDSEGASDEKPVHTVTLTYDYWMGKTEVTFDEYDAYTKATGKGQASDYSSWAGYNMGRGTRPVINVTWWDAIGYCNWLSEKEGIVKAYDNDGNLLDGSGNRTTDITKVKGYRLPTEAEWEYAARGGQNTRGYKYAGSNDLNEVGWYDSNSEKRTQSVGQKKPNELGLYDMSGNVWEWCHDWYDGKYYEKGTQTNPTGPGSGSDRVERGGSWSFNGGALGCRVAYRNDSSPTDSGYYLGFRLSRTSF